MKRIALFLLVFSNAAFAQDLSQIQSQLQKACDNERMALIQAAQVSVTRHTKAFSNHLINLPAPQRNALVVAAHTSHQLSKLNQDLFNTGDRNDKLVSHLEQDDLSEDQSKKVENELHSLLTTRAQLLRDITKLSAINSNLKEQFALNAEGRQQTCLNVEDDSGCINLMYEERSARKRRLYLSYSAKTRIADQDFNFVLRAVDTFNQTTFSPSFTLEISVLKEPYGEAVNQVVALEKINRILYTKAPECKESKTQILPKTFAIDSSFLGYEKFIVPLP